MDLYRMFTDIGVRPDDVVDAWEREQEMKERELAFSQCGVEGIYRDYTLGTYKVSSKGTESLKAAGLEFYQFVRDGGYRNLVLCGDRGTGKTGLVSGILHTVFMTEVPPARRYEGVRQYMSGVYVTAQELFTEFHYTQAFTPDKSLESFLKGYSAPDVLVIDEVDELAAKDNSFLFCVLDRRSAKHKSNILCTNYSWENFCKAMGAAIMSRLSQSLTYCNTFGCEDLRRVNV